jgi:hypothetical protein
MRAYKGRIEYDVPRIPQEATMPKTCAYCDKEKSLTKEHVWPSGFLDRTGRNSAHHSPKSGKVHGSDYIVRDVCQDCNNVHLSPLDDYFCKLYDDILSIPLGANSTVTLRYDYDMLCRVMLKIAFNTARSAGSEIDPFLRLRDYILHGGKCPDGVALIAELVSPSYIEDNSGPIPKIKEVLPTMYRSALAGLMTPNGKAVLARIVAVNSFFFHLLLSRNASDFKSFELAKDEFLSKVEGTVCLESRSRSVNLHSSPQDSLRSILPLIVKNKDQYSRFFEKQKNQRK